MTISQRVQQQFFTSSSPEQGELIRLPPTLLAPPPPSASTTANVERTATRGRQRQSLTPGADTSAEATPRQLPRRTNLWTIAEHERFLRGLEMYRFGPWKEIAAIVGTKTTRQTMSHAQKYRQKIERRERVNQAISSASTTSYSGVGRPVIYPHLAAVNLHQYIDTPRALATPRPPLGGFFHGDAGGISPSGVSAAYNHGVAPPPESFTFRPGER